MFKNTAGQYVDFVAFNKTTNALVTGDAANITCKVSIDDGARGALTNSAAELEDGRYQVALTAAETNGSKLAFYPESSTSDVVLFALPAVIWTRPPNFDDLGIETDGDVTKVNELNGHTAQSGDGYAVVNHGSHGNAALLTKIDAIKAVTDLLPNGGALSDLATILTRLPDTLSLANINAEVDTALADYDAPTKAELDTAEASIIAAVQAVNTGAARFIWIDTAGSYELDAAGSVLYPIEVRTYDGNGDPADIDSAADPTMTVTRTTDSQDLSANLSSITKISTGRYRMTLDIDATRSGGTGADIVAPLRIDASGLIATVSKSTSAHPVVTDAVAVDFTTSDRALLTAIKAVTDLLPDAGALSTIDGNVDAIKAVTDNLPESGALTVIDGNIDAIKAVTDAQGGTGAGLTDLPYNATAWDSPVQARAAAALVAIHLDHLLAATYDGASKPGAADSLLNEMVEDDGGLVRLTANALEEAPGGGGGGDASEANQLTLMNRLGLFTGTGANTILGFLQAMARNDASTPSDMGGTFSPASHSEQGIRVAIDGLSVGAGSDHPLARSGT